MGVFLTGPFNAEVNQQADVTKKRKEKKKGKQEKI